MLRDPEGPCDALVSTVPRIRFTEDSLILRSVKGHFAVSRAAEENRRGGRSAKDEGIPFMSQRMVRVSELVKREISDILHTRYQAESVYITITGVEVSPDLRHARVYYSVLGGEEEVRTARELLDREAREVRRILGRRVVLKYLPALNFIYDVSIERGIHLNALIDRLGLEEEETA